MLINSISKKKIAYISDHQFSLDRSDAGAEQVINTVSNLAAEGLTIRLIIPKRWRNLGVDMKRRLENICHYYQVRDKFELKELLHLPLLPLRLEKYSHALLATPYAKFTNHDLIYTRHRATALMALNAGLQLVFETYRIYARSPLNWAWIMARLTHRPNFLGLITHSAPSKERLVESGADANKIKVIENGFNSEHLKPRFTKLEARRQLGWDKKEKIVCYTGRLDKMKGIETVLELAERLRGIQFYLVGKTVSNNESWIQKAAQRKKLRNIKQLPYVVSKELPKYLFASDVLLIPPTAKPLMKYRKTVLPIKTFLYMAAGVPILAPDLPDTKGVLTNNNAALVTPDDLNSAEAAMQRIFDDRSWAQSIGKQVQLDSKKYTWEQRAKRITKFLNKRLNEREKAKSE